MEFGKNEHKRIQADSGKCTVSEVTFGSRRVDCIRVDGATCYVVEIKPNNEDAKSRGRTQINDGIKEIIRALEGKKKKSELTDKLEVFRQFSHVGLSAYFARAVGQDRELAERVARLLVDKRWPWIPWYAQFVGFHKRDDTASVRVGGKNGYAPLLGGFRSPRLQTLRMNRARGDGDFTSVQLPFDATMLGWNYEAPYDLLITCRSAELPRASPSTRGSRWRTISLRSWVR